MFQKAKIELNSTSRISGIDFLRAVAIISVVLFHFGYLPYGYLGVDLFFVISGFLVGGPLLQALLSGKKISLTNFYIKRITKILPSYFSFLIAGGFLSYYFYRETSADLVLWSSNVWKYLLFLVNYQGQGSYIFAHLWSVCIEEHFYILLPLVFLGLCRTKMTSRKFLFYFFTFSVMAMSFFRYWLYLHGKKTIVTTHSRLDSLGWGIAAAFIVNDIVLNKSIRLCAIFFGIIILATTIFIDLKFQSPLFKNVFFHGLSPIAFFLIIIYFASSNIPKIAWLQLIAFYSYNLYLWHMLFLPLVKSTFGSGFIGFVTYAFAGMLLAILFTEMIELPGLKLRKYFKDLS